MPEPPVLTTGVFFSLYVTIEPAFAQEPRRGFAVYIDIYTGHTKIESAGDTDRAGMLQAEPAVSGGDERWII